MNEIEVREQLAAYRAVTENATPSAALSTTILSTTPGRARVRRLVREARTFVLVAALVGSASGLWALWQNSRVERDVYVLVSLWSEGV